MKNNLQYKDFIRIKDPKEFRNKIQEIDKDLLKDSIGTDTQLWVDLLVSYKIFPVELYGVFQSNQDKALLVDSFIIGDFLPDSTFIESLINEQNDELLNKLIKKFVSIVLESKHLVLMMNTKMHKSLLSYLKNNSSTHKKELIIGLASMGVGGKEFIELLNDLDIKRDVYEALMCSAQEKESVDFLSDEVLSELINYDKGSFCVFLIEEIKFNILNREISYEAMCNIVSQKKNKKEKYDMKYHPKMEAIPVSEFGVNVLDVPESSKLRSMYIRNNYKHIQFPYTEMKEVIISLMYSREKIKIVLSVINNSKKEDLEDLIKQKDIVHLIESEATPSQIDLVGEDIEERALVLYGVLSYKFRKRISKDISLDKIPEEKNKKSYFDEVITAIRTENLDEFRRYTSVYGYTLTKFLFDSTQVSKRNKVESSRLGTAILKDFSYEEFRLVVESKYPFQLEFYDTYSPDMYPFKFKFDLDLAIGVYSELDDYRIIYFLDKEIVPSFIESVSMSDYYLNCIITNNRKFPWLDKSIEKLIVKKLTELDSIDISEENLDLLFLIDKEIIFNKVDYYSMGLLINAKVDGNNFFTKEEIKQYMTKTLDEGYFYRLETKDFIGSLSKNYPDLFNEWVYAYLKGSSEMSVFFGKKVSVRRGAKSLFEKYADQEKRGVDSILKDILENEPTLEKIMETFPDYKEVLRNNVPKGTIIQIENISSSLATIIVKENPHILFECERCSIENCYTVKNIVDEDFQGSNLRIKNLFIGALSGHSKKLIEQFNIPHENVMIDNIVGLLFHGDSKDYQEEVSFLLENFDLSTEICEYASNVGELTGDIFKDEILINHGLILTKDIIRDAIIKAVRWAEANYIKFIESKVGVLPEVVIPFDVINNYWCREDSSFSKMIKEKGFKVVSDKDYELIQIRETLQKQGSNFSPIDVRNLTINEKEDIISFISENIDTRFKEIDFRKLNINSLTTIDNFTVMQTMNSLELEDIINLLLVPNNIKNNKKILSGILDLMTINSGNFTYKVFLMKQVYETFKNKEELNLGDFIDYSNVRDVKPTEFFDKVSIENLSFLDQEFQSFGNPLTISTKKQVMRFLRSGESISETRDTFNMIKQVQRGRALMTEQVSATTDPLEISRIKTTLKDISSRLDEILAMDEMTHIHDRLVPLASFLTKDVNQPIGTTKYQSLNETDLEAELGYNLFFPQTRGDIHYLGHHYGWCVTGSCSYTEGVMKKGNILVGICEKGMPAEKENVIALAHFINNKGSLSLEQLRWSKLKKNGQRNVSAVSAFNYMKIKDYIEKYNKDNK